MAVRVNISSSACDGPVIHFDNVTKTYTNQSRPALENVSLDVENEWSPETAVAKCMSRLQEEPSAR